MSTEESRRKNTEYMREWRAKNPDKAEEISKRSRDKVRETGYQKIWRQSNPEKVRGYEKTYAEKWPEKLKQKERKRTLRKYNLTPEKYDLLLLSQGGISAIPGDSSKILVIDHDHESGVVRGLISREMNSAIGAFGDNPILLEAAARYLRERTPKYQTEV